MKNSAEYAAQLKKLLSRLKKIHTKFPMVSTYDNPLESLLVGCLTVWANEKKAESALKKLRAHFVDDNDMRVARPFEIGQILGKSFPKAAETAELIGRVLNAICSEYDCLDLTLLKTMGKREAKAALESYDGITPYVVAWVMMTCLEGHSFPINKKMYDMLMSEGVINPKSNMGDVQGFLERQITSNTLLETYSLLRCHCDSDRTADLKAETKTKKATAAKSKAKKTVAKKTASTQKATAKKTTAKKTAASKTSAKKNVKKTKKTSKK